MRERERERERERSQTADAHSNTRSTVYIIIVVIVYVQFGRIRRLYPHKHFSGHTYSDEFTLPLSACTCTADVTHGSYSMEFF